MNVGDRLDGRWEIVRPIGRGGMGAVYEAVHVELRRRVAVKVLDEASGADAARFAQEARALASLNHPNVVQVVESRADAHPPFLVMDLVDGRALDEIVQDEGPLAPRRAALVGAQLLAALGAAHRAGIIHRDVKPANVLVTDAGPVKDLVKVVDFGIAKLTLDPMKQTTQGVLLGSLAYMAPEQILGRAIDARVDVYATGVTLYVMLSGRAPFEGPSAPRVAMAICEQAPAPLACPPSLAAIVRRALEKDPSARFPTADAMRAELEAFAASPEADAPAARPPTTAPLAPPLRPSTHERGVAPLARSVAIPVAAAAPLAPATPLAPPAPSLHARPTTLTATPPPPRRFAAVFVVTVAGGLVLGVALTAVVTRKPAVVAAQRSATIAIDLPRDLPPDKQATQTEEDAIRRSIQGFGACLARSPLPKGAHIAVTHGRDVVIANPTGGAFDALAVFCVEEVDQKITGVRAGVVYHVRP